MENTDDTFELVVNGGQYESTRHNTTLFTFFGELALYNHVFLQLEQADNVVQGAFVFSDHQVYPHLVAFIAEHEFPMVLNRTELPECDANAWHSAHIEDFSDIDTVPDDWTL